MSAPQQIDTRRSGTRRRLRFETIDQALADAESVAAAERAGTARRMGNWSTGQILGHLASWAEYAYAGAPMKPPWIVRLVLKTRKNAFLNKAMPAGLKIPRVPGGTFATDFQALEEGLARFRQAFTRLGSEPPTLPHPIFGTLTHEEWIKSHLRHAELHLSFVDPGGSPA